MFLCSGNRGIKLEIWNNTGNLDVDDIDGLNDTDSGYSVHHVDVATYIETLRTTFLAKMTGKCKIKLRVFVGKETQSLYSAGLCE